MTLIYLAIGALLFASLAIQVLLAAYYLQGRQEKESQDTPLDADL